MVVFLHSWSSVLCLFLCVCVGGVLWCSVRRVLVMAIIGLILLLKSLLHLMEFNPNFTYML
jgi:hypothetical protein